MKKHTPKSKYCPPTENMKVNKHQANAGSGVPPYDLASLLGQCDFDVPHPKDMQMWNDMRPAGREF